jgi:hypothetical protein
MVTDAAVEKAFQGGFLEERAYPDLPRDPKDQDRFTWDKQKQKYCQGDLWKVLKTQKYRIGLRTKTEGGKPKLPEPIRESIEPHTDLNKSGYVFCHRGFYDHAKGIHENSLLALENGVMQGLLLHEIDGILYNKKEISAGFAFAHDQVLRRTTGKSGRWSQQTPGRLRETYHATRRWNQDQDTFATSYVETDQRIAELKDVILLWLEDNRKNVWIQLDLRRNDFAEGLSRFNTEESFPDGLRLLLKGYNTNYSSYNELKEAMLASEFGPGRNTDFFGPMSPHAIVVGNPTLVMMVFYPDPIIALALKNCGFDSEHATLELREFLPFKVYYTTLLEQLLSFYEAPEFTFIFEITHTGLGLGYNKQDSTAKNPLTGAPLENREVIFQSRIDRVMIEAGLELRKICKNSHPNRVNFSSCTRLCDVRTPEKQFKANWKTGHMEEISDDETGLGTRLRTIHGGLYPQSDLVVADDPLAEIAARSWIDEYAELDPQKLLHMSYNDWLADAGMRMPELVSAMEKINGPFLPNTFTGRMEDIWNIAVDDEEDANSGQGAGSLSDSRVQAPSNDAGSISLGGSGDIAEFMRSESLEEQREDVDSHRETAHSEDSSGSAAVPQVDSLRLLEHSNQPIIKAEKDRNNLEVRNNFKNSNNIQNKVSSYYKYYIL